MAAMRHTANWLVRYGRSLLIVLTALFIEDRLRPLIGAKIFLLSYPAVFLSALLDGFGPGIFATMFAGFGVFWAFMPPIHRWGIEKPEDGAALGVFVLMGIAFSAFSGRMRKTKEALIARELDQRRSNEKLREQASLIDLAHDAIIVRDLESRIQSWNDGAVETYGWSENEAKGRISHELLSTRFPHPLHEIEDELFGKGEWIGELIHRARDGRQVAVESRWSIERDSLGAPKAILEINRDITQRKRAQEALATRERDFRSLAEAMPQIVWVTRPDGWNIYFNHQWVDYTGLSLDESYGHGWNKPFHPDDQRRAWDAWQNAVNHLATYSLECRLRRHDGVYRWWLVRGVPVFDEQGKITKWFGTCTDIEDIKETEQALAQLNRDLERKVSERTDRLQKEVREREESQRIYRAIGESIDYGIWICDVEGRNIYASESFLKLVGLTQEECSEFGWGKVLHPDDAERTIAAWKETVRTGGNWDIQHRFRGVDGRWYTILARGVPVRNEKGEIVRWAGINLDISALKETEEALRQHAQALEQSEAKFKVLAEAIPQLCWIAHADGSLFWYNQRWYQYTGTTPEEIKGWGLQSVHDPQFLPSVLERWKKSLQTGTPFEMEFPLRGADGRFRWFLTRVLPLRDSNDKIINWFGTSTDIDAQRRALSEREELLRAIRTANEQLEQRVQERTRDLMRSNQELEQFAYIASHDLQTPLRHIASYVQLLVGKVRQIAVIDPQMEKWINYTLAGTQQMKELITDLLSYSRVGRIDVAVEEVEVSQVIAAVCESLREPIRKTGAHVKRGDLPVVFGVRSQLTQLFQNLIENAIKFRTPGVSPQIEIRSEDSGEFWKFSVSDNGIGFDPKYAERIFTMFQRLHRTEEYKGTGIGLAICKKIVEFHGGNIGANATEGKGSIFYFNLPKKERISSRVIRPVQGAGFKESA